MKTTFTSFCAALLLSATMCLNAGEAAQAKKASPEFERMKTLVGTWKGKADMGQGPVEFTAQYRVIAAGSVLEERVFPDSPNEMVTMYFDNKDGKLAMTHYCMMGNRPEMILKTSDAKTLQFDFNQACGIDCAKESHMHALTIRFDDADTITSSCKALMEGKEMPEHATTMKRVKSSASAAK